MLKLLSVNSRIRIMQPSGHDHLDASGWSDFSTRHEKPGGSTRNIAASLRQPEGDIRLANPPWNLHLTERMPFGGFSVPVAVALAMTYTILPRLVQRFRNALFQLFERGLEDPADGRTASYKYLAVRCREISQTCPDVRF